MIVKTITDFCNISYDGNKIATSANAAYWLACQRSIDCRSSLEIQEKDILDAFHKMADLLGYRVEKIEPEEPAIDALPASPERSHDLTPVAAE